MAALIAGGPGDNGDDDLSELLRKILALDELKIDTPAVRKIKDVLAQFMLYNGTEKAQLQLLVDTLRKAYDNMLKSVQRRQSVSSKLSKLYSLFHQFSVKEGYELCYSFEKEMKLQPVSEILWQLLLETVFNSLKIVFNFLNFNSSSLSCCTTIHPLGTSCEEIHSLGDVTLDVAPLEAVLFRFLPILELLLFPCPLRQALACLDR